MHDAGRVREAASVKTSIIERANLESLNLNWATSSTVPTPTFKIEREVVTFDESEQKS